MPRVAGSSQTLLHMQQQYGGRETYTNVGLGANTSIASRDRMSQPKEAFGMYQRNASTDSFRSTRSTDEAIQTFSRKPPQKAISCNTSLRPPPQAQIQRNVSDQSAFSLQTPTKQTSSTERRRRYNSSSQGHLLPLTSNSTHEPQNRSRTASLTSFAASPFRRVSETQVTRSLRKRGRGSVHSDDEGNIMLGGGPRYGNANRYPSMDAEDFSHHKNDHKPKYRAFSSLLPGSHRWTNLKSFHSVVLVLLFCVACFTASSYRKVFDATSQLVSVQRGESMMLLHLHKLEEQLIELHNYIRHLTDRSEGSLTTNEGGAKLSVDTDLLDVQMRNLREMEVELDHEVRSLQSRLSESAKRSIVSNFGEGAVQVDLDVSFGDNDNGAASGIITIRLWHDTPHSAWTFLQQVENGAWNGSKFSIYQGRALFVQKEDGSDITPQVDFIEKSKNGHDKYTVGLTDTGIILNMQDNRDYFKKEASVGVIVSGFDTLRHLVSEVEERHSKSAVVRHASVSHHVQK